MVHALQYKPQSTDTCPEQPKSEEVVSVMQTMKQLDMPTKLSIAANCITENLDFKKEFLYLHNLGISFDNDFDLNQINLEMAKPKVFCCILLI